MKKIIFFFFIFLALSTHERKHLRILTNSRLDKRNGIVQMSDTGCYVVLDSLNNLQAVCRIIFIP